MQLQYMTVSRLLVKQGNISQYKYPKPRPMIESLALLSNPGVRSFKCCHHFITCYCLHADNIYLTEVFVMRYNYYCQVIPRCQHGQDSCYTVREGGFPGPKRSTLHSPSQVWPVAASWKDWFSRNWNTWTRTLPLWTRTRTPPRWTRTQALWTRTHFHGLGFKRCGLGLHLGGLGLTLSPGESGEKYTVYKKEKNLHNHDHTTCVYKL